jgi:hypothetical protein
MGTSENVLKAFPGHGKSRDDELTELVTVQARLL